MFKHPYDTFCFLIFLPFQVCQILRIITFYSTQLPGPNYHCREVKSISSVPFCFMRYLEVRTFILLHISVHYNLVLVLQGSKLARLPPPQSVFEVLLINCELLLLCPCLFCPLIDFSLIF